MVVRGTPVKGKDGIERRDVRVLRVVPPLLPRNPRKGRETREGVYETPRKANPGYNWNEDVNPSRLVSGHPRKMFFRSLRFIIYIVTR